MGLLYTFCTVLGALDQRVKASSKETNDITRCAGAGKEGDGDPQVSGPGSERFIVTGMLMELPLREDDDFRLR